MVGSLTRPAHAKVNLALAVAPPEPAGSPRAGWHRICSWMSAIDLHDEVTLTPHDRAGERADASAARFVPQVSWATDAPRASPIDWPPEKDLCARALLALDRLLTPRGLRVPPVRITVRKRIPVGGGLGGGSSDAAATLLLAQELMGGRALGPGRGHDLVPLDDLRQAARSIGSDVEFFLDDPCRTPEGGHVPPRPAIVSGFGDELERLAPVELPLVLLLPGVGCPTREVYRAYDAAPRPLDEARVRELARSGQDGAHDARAIAASLADGAFNDLAEPAARAVPAFGAILERTRAALPRPVHVSGSGSSMFIIARDAADQDAIVRAAGSLAPGVAALPVRTR